MKKIGKKESQEQIRKFFEDKHDSEEVRKIKKVAMSHNIKLKELRKKFCKKCYSMNLKVKSIKKKMKVVECKDCKNTMRWGLK